MSVSTKDRALVGRTEYRLSVATGPDESGNFDEHGGGSYADAASA